MSLVVDASFNGSESVPVALIFNVTTSTLSKYVDATSNTSAYNADIRKDWINIQIGETTTSESWVSASNTSIVQRWSYARWSNRTKCSDRV